MSIRLRLASWCVAIFCALFIVLAVVISAVHARAHYRDLDDTLAAVTVHYQSEIDRELANGAPLNGDLVVAVDAQDRQLVGTELVVYDAAGGAILGRPLPGAAPSASPGDRPPHGAAAYLTLDTPDGRVRTHTMALTGGSQTVGYVQTSVSLAKLDRSIFRFRLLLMAAMIVGLAVALVGSLATASRALRPVAVVTETARAIALSRGFGRRLAPTAQRDELGELTRTFNEMLTSLDEAHRGQRRFVDDAAHELRAPLTSILGNLELLTRAPDLPATEREAMLNDVQAEAERMGRMVNELLTLARADAGQQPVRRPVDLDRVVVDVVRQARSLADGVTLALDAVEPVVVQGDVDRLRQLLLILVENALRYTPAGGRVGVSLRAKPDVAVVAVTDTGIGIAPDDLPRVFDRFYRADPARSRVAGGTGLGLAIAKWIADAHDAGIDVESKLGEGTTFAFRIPVSPSS